MLTWLNSIFLMVVFTTGVSVLFRGGGVLLALSGIAGPALCWWAGSGATGALLTGNRSQKATGVVCGVLCLGIGMWMVSATEFGVYLFGLSPEGIAWGLVSCLVGVLVTAPRARSLAAAEVPAPPAGPELEVRA